MNEQLTKSVGKFHESLARLISAKLEPYKQRDLDTETCTEIYVTIFETITSILKETKAPLGNEAANYLSQQYYEATLITNKAGNAVELDPNIFNQLAKLEEIPTKEIAFMSMLLEGTDFRLPLVAEIRRRS